MMQRCMAIALAISILGATAALGPVSAGPQKQGKTGLQAQKREGGPGLKMAQELNLTTAQQTKLKAIRADQKAQMMALKQNSLLPPEEKRARMRSIRQASQARVRQILTPDQQKKWAALRSEQRAEKKKLAAQRVQKQASAGPAKIK